MLLTWIGIKEKNLIISLFFPCFIFLDRFDSSEFLSDSPFFVSHLFGSSFFPSFHSFQVPILNLKKEKDKSQAWGLPDSEKSQFLCAVSSSVKWE